MPPELADFPLEVQQAFVIHDFLPDRWDGMSGAYMGKDLSALGEIMKVYGVEDTSTVLYFFKWISIKNSESINAKVRQRQKQPKELGRR